MCWSGTKSTCTGAWGLMSSKAMHRSSRITSLAGIWPSRILQNTQSDMARGTLPGRPVTARMPP